MTHIRRFVSFACVPLVLVTCAFANHKDDDAKAMVQRAANLSSIRAKGAPPFRLKANLKITQGDGSVAEGTYTETWVTDSQWRSETVLGGFQRTQVVMGSKIWTSDSSTTVPEGLDDTPGTFDPWRGFAKVWKVDKFEDQEVDGRATTCFRTKSEGWGVSEFCFESSTGTLAARILPVHVSNKTVDALCIYRDYQSLGDRRVPTSYSCFEDKKLRLQAQIVELTLRPELDEKLFAPLPDGKESARCLAAPRPPMLIESEEPFFPGVEKGIVTISLRVGTDGRTHDLKVVDSVDKESDEAALAAVRKWKFKPATCEGQPVDVAINVQVDFHLVH